MGKQRRTKGIAATPPRPANSTNWEKRARELVDAGICSPMILDHGIENNDRRPIEQNATTKPRSTK